MQDQEEIQRARQMLPAISQIQKYPPYSQANRTVLFDDLLDASISVTNSEFGFIGEVLKDETGEFYLKTFAMTNIAWDKASLKFYHDNIHTGLEFRNPDTLFGSVMRSGNPVFANETPYHDKSGGLPDGHPPLNTFLGVPLYSGAELVGMIGLGNRPDGYSQKHLDECEPLFSTIGSLIHRHRIEEQRQIAEESLEETNERLNQALDISQMGYWDLDLISGKLVWDKQTRKIHEVGDDYKPKLDEAINFYAPESRERVKAVVQQAINDRQSYFFDEQLITATGKLKWVRSRGRAVVKDGLTVGLAGVFMDITSAKMKELELKSALEEASRHQQAEAEARAALKSSEYRLKSAIEAGKLGIWSYSPADDIIYCSARWAEILDRPAFALTLSMGQAFNLIHPEDRDRVRKAIERHFREHTDGYSIDARNRCMDGSYKWTHIHGMVIERDENGRPILVCGTLQDISKRKSMETELRQMTQKLKIAIESSSIGMWDLNIETGELVWDEGMARIYGVEHQVEPRVFEDWARHLHPDDYDKTTKAAQYTMDTGAPYNIEFRINSGDGLVKHLRGAGLVCELDDRQKHLIGINIDIYQDVALNRALKDQRRRADEANKAKSQFLANMSHEIRTPLNGILGMAQLLGRTHLDQSQQEYANTILSSGQALLELIEDVLDISKIEAGLLTLNPSAFDITELMRTTLAEFQNTADQKDVSLTLEIEDTIPQFILGDRKRIRQVLVNLIGNALKFTDTGSISISLSNLNNTSLRFEVTDTGPGIPPEQHQFIFDRFAQADGSLNRQHGGAGLGLAICKEILKLAGGRMGVESIPDEGSTFWFEYPLNYSAPAETKTTSEDPDQRSNSASTGRCILVAEDNPVNRAVASGMLQSAGFEICEAENGKMALEQVKARKPDGILLDLHMPEMNGDEFLIALKANPETRDIPVIALSADATPDARALLIKHGVRAYFTKPFDLEVVLQRLTEELDLKDTKLNRAS